jgi:hypothetical protein
VETDPEGLEPFETAAIPPPPINFVAIQPELSGCGRYAFASWDILVNKHDTKRIRVYVQTKWVYQGTGLDRTDPYDLEPKQRLNLGCDFWRPDLDPLQEFDRKITRALYL